MNYKSYHTPVVLSESIFRDYMFSNHVSELSHEELLSLLRNEIDLGLLVHMAKEIWELPFDRHDELVVLSDADRLLDAHTPSSYSEQWDEADDDRHVEEIEYEIEQIYAQEEEHEQQGGVETIADALAVAMEIP